MIMADTKRLKVAIAGGGIGGLSAAVALRQQGHEVEVFEKSKLHSEIGAAVHSAPNCTAALSRLDVHPPDIGGVLHTAIKFVDTECETKMLKVYSQEDKKDWQAEYYLVNRIDLHAALKEKAVDPERTSPPVQMHTNTAVIGMDCENASLTLEDGTTVQADLVVGADGIHSRTRAFVTGHQVPLFSTGKCCYRTLIPTADLLADPQTRPILDRPGGFVQIAAPDRRICMYPCSSGELTNLVIFVPRGEVGEIKKGATGYDQTATKRALLTHFQAFSPPVIRMLEMAPDNGVKLWDLLDMELQDSLIKDRAVLIGDAAHPFLPHMGQGAAQAIEDGCALGVIMAAGTTAEEIPARLALWEQCRKERAHKIVEFTRHRSREADGSQGPPQTVEEFHAAMSYCTSHDAWKHAEEQLHAWLQQRV